MIIDCHTHIGRNDHINATPAQLLKSMDVAGIDKALVFASKLADCPNEWMLEQVKPHRDRLLPVAAATLPGNNMSDIQQEAGKLSGLYRAGDIVAVKFYTGYDHYYPSDRLIEDYLMSLEDVGCPAIFHSGDCLNSVKSAKLKYAHPLHIDEVAVDYPGMNFIIAHMGFPWIKDAAEVCHKNDNVYADISGFVYGEFKFLEEVAFERAINEFLSIAPSNKLLFGTDYPISNQKSYTTTLDKWFGETLTAQRLTENVQKAFKLK